MARRKLPETNAITIIVIIIIIMAEAHIYPPPFFLALLKSWSSRAAALYTRVRCIIGSASYTDTHRDRSAVQ